MGVCVQKAGNEGAEKVIGADGTAAGVGRASDLVNPLPPVTRRDEIEASDLGWEGE